MIRNWIETERLSGLRAGGRFVLRIFPYCMMGPAVLSMEKISGAGVKKQKWILLFEISVDKPAGLC